MNRKNIPNIICVFRILLVYPIVIFLVQHNFNLALILFIVAGISDGVDGYLARKYDWSTELGGWLDPIADKTLQVSVYIVLSWLGLIPWWLLAAVILRDIVIVAGGLYYFYKIERVEAAPSLISKLNTVMQLLLVVIIMVDKAWYALPIMWIDMLIYVVLATTILSGVDYVWTWTMKAVRARAGSAND